MAVRWFASGNVDHVPATIFADGYSGGIQGSWRSG
jgi:hypothetical protein